MEDREYYEPKGMYENYLYEGTAELLRKLKRRGKELAVATSKPAVYAEGILRMFGIREYFTFVSGSELNGERTDKAEEELTENDAARTVKTVKELSVLLLMYG